MNERGEVDMVVLTIIVAIVAVIGLTLWATIGKERERERLIAQCQADNKKEYECKAMFKAPETTVVPVYVYSGSR